MNVCGSLRQIYFWWFCLNFSNHSVSWTTIISSSHLISIQREKWLKCKGLHFSFLWFNADCYGKIVEHWFIFIMLFFIHVESRHYFIMGTICYIIMCDLDSALKVVICKHFHIKRTGHVKLGTYVDTQC